MNVKKKLKEYDSFKNLIIECLEEILKKVPKKIRKQFEGELINKNRTTKCEIIFKCINQFMTYSEEQQIQLANCLHREHNISSI